MAFWIIYILKVMIIQAICFGCYRFLLSGSKFHFLNRAFLLVTLVGAFAIPFIRIPQQLPQVDWPLDEAITLVRISDNLGALIPTDTPEIGLFNIWLLLRIVYLLVSGWLILRLGRFLYFIFKLKKQSEYVDKSWFKLYKTRHLQAFSFFADVFMPGQIFGTSSYEQVLSHECVHVRQLHSLDRLLVDLMVSLFWFNPFIYWYRKALIEIHEYQADAAVIKAFGDPIGYQEILFSQLQTGDQGGLVSHFNFSVIKKRIVMINKQNIKFAQLRFLAILPVVAMIVFAFTSRAAVEPIETMGNSLLQVLGPDPGLDIVTSWTDFGNGIQQNEIPSILPISEPEKVRTSSGFGMRMDPISKVKKMHQGIDFAGPKGLGVIASADGKVETVAFDENGYGHHIIISHGDTYKTLYAQLSQAHVAVGDKVLKGQKIGEIGNSGRSTAPHLHYEVIKADEGNVNPVDYIKNYKISLGFNSDANNSGVPSMLPLNLPFNAIDLYSGFGMRMDPVMKVKKLHTGIDFRVEIGTAVVATADGVVEIAENQPSGYGKYIVLKHDDGFETWYAHLSEMLVKKGDVVKAGDMIAKSGNTGKSSAPHLHYAIKKDGEFVDPMPFLGEVAVDVDEVEILSQIEVEKITMQAMEEMKKAMAMIDEHQIELEIHRAVMETHREQMELARVIMDSVNVEELQQMAIDKQQLALELQKFEEERQKISVEMALELEQLAAELEQLKEAKKKKK